MMLMTCVALTLGLWAPVQAQTTAPPGELLAPASLEKLRNVTLSGSKTSALDASIATMLGVSKDGGAITVKQLEADTALGRYVLTIPVKPATEDILFSFREPSGVTYNYLSDSRRALRAAMVSDADGNRPLKNEDAEEGFRNTLKAWALIAPRVPKP
jgi:hypothetical protein